MTDIKSIGNSVVLLLICFVLISCRSVSFTENQTKEIISNSYSLNTNQNLQEIKSESRFPIIEIWQELDGSVPIRGKSLYFRMYDNGEVEFDYILKKKDGLGNIRHTFSLIRTPFTKLSEEEFSRLKLLLEGLSKSKNIKQEYKPVGLIFDVMVKLTILIKENDTFEKKIIINNGEYDVTDDRFKNIFPKPLVELLKETNLIRSRLQEEKKD